MLKYLSILVALGSFGLTNCSTKRFSDVVPETRGTALGSVTIGKENADYFVVPSGQTVAGGYDHSPSSIVVFKTKERHPGYRAAHLAGAPVRTVNKVGSGVIGGVTDIAGALITQPFQSRPEPSQARSAHHGHPAVYPSSSARPSSNLAYPALSVAPEAARSTFNPALHHRPPSTHHHMHNPYSNPFRIY